VTTLGAVITPLYICLAAVYRIRALAIKAELIHRNVIWVERRLLRWPRNCPRNRPVGVLERCLRQIKRRHGDIAYVESVLRFWRKLRERCS
jgi:hypothetical protein